MRLGLSGAGHPPTALPLPARGSPSPEPTEAGRGLLGQQVTREHLLAGLSVVLRLEPEHRLGLVLGQPEGLEVEVRERERQTPQPGGRWARSARRRPVGTVGRRGLGRAGRHSPVPGHVQHVQLRRVGELGRQGSQAVVPQGENAERRAASDLRRQRLEAVAVRVEVGQLGQLPQRARQGLARERAGRGSAETCWASEGDRRPPGRPPPPRRTHRFPPSTSRHTLAPQPRTPSPARPAVPSAGSP